MHANNLKILLVEDNPFIAEDLKNSLELVGYSVSEPLFSGEEAIALMKKEHFDLAVLDIELEGKLTGLEVGKRISEIKQTPIIFITGAEYEGYRKEAMEIGAHSFLNKPFNEKNLINAIDLAMKEEFGSDRRRAEGLKSYVSKVFVKVNKRFIKLEIEDIDYLEASGHYMVIHIGEQQLSSSISLSEFLSKYQLSAFVRVHRSFVVNLDKVSDFDDTHIYFGTKMVPISKSMRRDFRDRISVI